LNEFTASAGVSGAFLLLPFQIRYLPDPKTFKLFVDLVLLYLGYRLLSEVMGWNKKVKAQNTSVSIYLDD